MFKVSSVMPQTGVHSAVVKLQLSRKEAAESIGVSLRTLDRLIAFKEISVRRIGRRVLIHRETIEHFAKSGNRKVVAQ